MTLFFLVAIFGHSCDQSIHKGDDKLTEGRQGVTALYKTSEQKVAFDDLETVYPISDDSPMVSIEDVVLGSGMISDLEKVYLNFVGEDGFTPIGVCPEEYAPLPGTLAKLGFIERGTTRLVWKTEADFERCMNVKDVIRIEIADKADDLPLRDTEKDASPKPSTEGVPFVSVEMHFEDESITMDIANLETDEIQSEEVVLLRTLIEAADIPLDEDTVLMDFESSDGYRPSVKGMCSDYIPAPGAYANLCGINVATSELIWDASLNVEKCAGVRLVAHIYIIDD